jgi:hypothetical protein
MRRQENIEKLVLHDGWYWLRLFVPLRGGYSRHEWLPARVEGDKVRLFGSARSIPLSASVLDHALWHGPIDPPVVEPMRTGLALERGRYRKKRRADAAGDPRFTAKVQLLANGIVQAFVQTSDDLRVMYKEQPKKLAELVDRVRGLLERAFGGGRV